MLSTVEAEYIAAVHAAKEVAWLWTLLQELGMGQQKPTILNADNQSAIALCRDSKFHARTKHMDIRYHFIREMVENGIMKVTYIPSASNPADIMTKPLPCKAFESFVAKLGVREL